MNRQRLACWLGALLLGVAAQARADVLLLGSQHVGDDENGAFTPSDPVTRAQMRSNPSRFHLSQSTTITAVRFENVVSLSNQIEGIELDGDGVLRTGTLSGKLFTLTSPRTLSAGTHTIFPDPGCFDGSGVRATCPAASENDIGFSALTLVSAQTSTSHNLNRRRHIGDDIELLNDNYLGDYYPDEPDLLPTAMRADIAFYIDTPRVLTLIQFYRLRGVNTPLGSEAQVLIDGQLVGLLASSGDPLDLSVSPVRLLSAGTHTLSVIAGTTAPGNRDSISWDDILLLFSAPSVGTPGRFNAVDTTDTNKVSGNIRTKVSAAPFTLDVVTLDLAGTAQLAEYEGTVSVELLDTNSDSGAVDAYGCRSSWLPPVQALGSLTFTPADAGLRSLDISYPNVLRRARIRVTDANTGIAGCSTDAFAIRPLNFGVEVSDGTPSSAGTTNLLDDTGTGGNRTHRAGQPFTVRATARNAAGATTSAYTSSPVLSVQSTIAGGVAGTFTVGSWSGAGTRRTNTARYSEAGTFNLRVRDSSFANIDAGDTSLAEREIDGVVGVGRFTPDHFHFVSRAGQLAPACGTFSYEGQPILFSTAAQFVMQAVSAADTPTLNYTGSLFKLATPTPAVWDYSAANGNTSGVAMSPTTAAVSGQDSGMGVVTLNFSTAPLSVLRDQPRAPTDLELQLAAASGITDADGIAYNDTQVPRIGQAADGLGIAFDVGTNNQVRFGRLFVQNAYGSELMPLDVPFGTEYFVGSGASGGFTRNLADSCTTVAAPALSGALVASTSVQSITAPLLAGLGSLRLAAPTGAATGSVNLLTTPAAWLLGDSDRNGVYDNAIESLATFGLARSRGEQQIYLRETYR